MTQTMALLPAAISVTTSLYLPRFRCQRCSKADQRKKVKNFRAVQKCVTKQKGFFCSLFMEIIQLEPPAAWSPRLCGVCV